MIIGKYKESIVAFDEKKAENKHICLLGKSGSGKSVAAQKLILEMVKNGSTVIALDIHRVLDNDNIFQPLKKEFDKYANIVDLLEKPMGLNLFESAVLADGRMESPSATIGGIVDSFNRTYRLGDVQRSELRKAIAFVYEKNLYHTQGLKAIRQALYMMGGRVAATLADKMYPLFAEDLFIDGNSSIVPSKLNIIRLSHMDLESQSVVADIILSHIFKKSMMASPDEDIALFLDESQNYQFSHNSPLSLILTEGRKFRVHAVLASQSLKNFSNTQQHKILQSGLGLYFKQSDSERRAIASIISPNRVSDYSLLLASLEVGEAIAVGKLLVDGQPTLTPIKIAL